MRDRARYRDEHEYLEVIRSEHPRRSDQRRVYRLRSLIGIEYDAHGRTDADDKVLAFLTDAEPEDGNGHPSDGRHGLKEVEQRFDHSIDVFVQCHEQAKRYSDDAGRDEAYKHALGARPYMSSKICAGEFHIGEHIELINHVERPGQRITKDLFLGDVIPNKQKGHNGYDVEKIFIRDELVKAEGFAVLGVIYGFISN